MASPLLFGQFQPPVGAPHAESVPDDSDAVGLRAAHARPLHSPCSRPVGPPTDGIRMNDCGRGMAPPLLFGQFRPPVGAPHAESVPDDCDAVCLRAAHARPLHSPCSRPVGPPTDGIRMNGCGRGMAPPLLFGQFQPPVGAPHAESVPDDSDAVGLRAAHARPLHSPCSRPVGPPTDGIRMNDCGRGMAPPLLFVQFRPPVGAPHAESVPDDSDAVGLRAAHARPLHSPCSRPVGPPTDGIRMNDCGRGMAPPLPFGQFQPPVGAPHAESVPDDSDAVGLRAAHARPLHSPCSRPVGPPTDGIRMNDCGRGMAPPLLFVQFRPPVGAPHAESVPDDSDAVGLRAAHARPLHSPCSRPVGPPTDGIRMNDCGRGMASPLHVEINNDCLGDGMRLAGEDIAGLHLLC